MTLPASGAISFSQINTELSLSSTAQISLNDSAVRTLFGQTYGSVDMNTGHGKSSITPGSATYTSPGSYTFVVPAGITSISAVAISGGGGGGAGYAAVYGNPIARGGDGGGLGYVNNFSVTPGQSMTVSVGAGGLAYEMSLCGYNGGPYVSRTATSGGGSGLSAITSGSVLGGAGGYNGGTCAQVPNGGYATGAWAFGSICLRSGRGGLGGSYSGYTGGGGGAGGYGVGALEYCSYNHTNRRFPSGGRGGAWSFNPSRGVNGGGGGGSAGHSAYWSAGGGGGGGTSYWGLTCNQCGNGGFVNANPISNYIEMSFSYGGFGGAYGCQGGPGQNISCGYGPRWPYYQPQYANGRGGNFGGGGGGQGKYIYASYLFSESSASPGAGGAVKIVYPGNTRSYPSTCVGYFTP
jgi:hypothetical protein